MKKNHLFVVSLLSVLLYELAMIFFGLQGVSLIKLVVTVLLWVSFIVALIEFKGRYGIVKKIIPLNAFAVFIFLLIWNVLTVFRSLLFRDDTVTTILGNNTTSMALLVPFALVFAIRKSNLHYLQRYYFALIYIGIPLFMLLFIVTGGSFPNFGLPAIFLLLTPIAFLIAQLPYLAKKKRLLVILGSVILFVVASRSGIRTMMIRELLMYAGLVPILLYHIYRVRWIFYIGILGLFAPLFLIQQGVATGVSPFEQYLSFSDDDELATDTRTFLWIELYDDLIENKRFLIGKGATGKYYSDYFSRADGDSSQRINMEVGILGILLKGGVIGVFLNLILFGLAIFYAFFRSKNSYVVAIGFIIYIHFILLFLENVIKYSTYNFLIWFCVGICLSKDMRQLTNRQVRILLSGNRV